MQVALLLCSVDAVPVLVAAPARSPPSPQDLMPDSPASLVGLRRNEDFIVGSEKVTFQSVAKLEDLLKRMIAQTVVLHVYNAVLDCVRPVAVVPHASWPGGITKKEGAHWQLLGCGVGFGPKHALPEACRATVGTNAGA